MKLSQAIQQLQSILVEHGDLELKNESVDDSGKRCLLEPRFITDSLETVVIRESYKDDLATIDSIADYIQEHYTP